jgi:hypothetical protein
MAYEEVEAPVGQFISWGNKKGQHVTGKLLDYDETGGNDFGNNPCPLLEIELTEKAASITKDGERTDYAPGEIVMLSCGQASLKRKVKRADLKRGDLVKIQLKDLLKVSNGTLKEFSVAVDRSKSSSDGFDDAGGDDDDEPPF